MDDVCKAAIMSVVVIGAVFTGAMSTAVYVEQKNSRNTKKYLVSTNPEMTLIKKEAVHVPAEEYYGKMMHLSHPARDFTRLEFDTDGNLETAEIKSYHGYGYPECSEYEERLKTIPVGTKKTFTEWDAKLTFRHKDGDSRACRQFYERCRN